MRTLLDLPLATAQDLISSLLVADPAARMGIGALKRHIWISDELERQQSLVETALDGATAAGVGDGGDALAANNRAAPLGGGGTVFQTGFKSRAKRKQ